LKKRNLFVVFWLLTTAVFGWFVVQGHQSFNSPTTPFVLIGLLIGTALLWWLFPVPAIETSESSPKKRRGLYILAAVIVVVALFLARTLVGPPLLFTWPILAFIILAYLKPTLDRREVVYATVLALITGIAGLGAQWVWDDFSPIAWALLQVGLVLTGLLAGWAMLRHTGLWQAGIGHSQFLDNCLVPAFIHFGQGVLMAMPWALGLILIGGAASSGWVQSWWQPFLAINPGIAEEVWGRIFAVPVLFWLFSRFMNRRRAYLGAMLIMNYWFAYLHTPGGFDAILSTLMIGTLYGLPHSVLCLHHDLETAVGFHFWIDFVKFGSAMLLNMGLWVG